MRTSIYTCLALAAFAANSVLCRVALSGNAIDPASFSTLRFGAGAAVLWLVVARALRSSPISSGSWRAAAALFFYAVPFAFAYITLTAGTGALILFGAVQITMLSAAIASGERPTAQQWIGLTAAAAGLVYLVAPGLDAPPLAGAGLMATAGIAWGIYSLYGRGAANPLAQTAGNFARVVPLIAVVSAITLRGAHLTARGVVLAIVSGALASGLGYVVWYGALRRLTATRAAIVQLAVPLLAAAGGVFVLSEPLTPRLAIAAMLVLGGIGLAVTGREQIAVARAAVIERG